MAWVLGHRQTKGAATDIPYLPSPRHTSTLPEEHQRIKPLAREHQRRIGKLSVAQSTAYRQLRLSIRSGLCYQQIGDRTPTISAAQPSPRAGAVRARWLLACAAPSHAAHRGFVDGQLAEAPNLFWMCTGR